MFDITDYSEKYLDQYRQRSFETVLVRVRRDAVLRSMARHPHRNVLEVGCGLDPLFLHSSDYERFTVVEPSPDFVKAARDRVPQQADVLVIQGYFGEGASPVERGPFDFVAVSSLLHEVPDPRALLAAVREVCDDSTVVHLNVPNVRSFHRLLALEMGVIESLFEPSAMEAKFQRQSRYDQESLARTVEEAGFSIVDSGTYFIKPFTHGQMEALLESGSIDEAVITGLERMTKYMPGLGCEMFVEMRRAR